MVKCADCGKETSEDSVVYCDMCGASLCEECGTTGLRARVSEVANKKFHRVTIRVAF